VRRDISTSFSSWFIRTFNNGFTSPKISSRVDSVQHIPGTSVPDCESSLLATLGECPVAPRCGMLRHLKVHVVCHNILRLGCCIHSIAEYEIYAGAPLPTYFCLKRAQIRPCQNLTQGQTPRIFSNLGITVLRFIRKWHNLAVA